MHNSAHLYSVSSTVNSSKAKINVYEIKTWFENWNYDCEYRQFSNRTLENHRGVSDRFLWWLDHAKIAVIDEFTVRRFITYLSESDSRWGNQSNAGCLKPASRATVETYFRILRAFFNWCAMQGYTPCNLMSTLDKPLKSKRQIAPFEQDEVKQIVKACEKSKYFIRNDAIVHFLLGTGVRASEFCCIRGENVNWDHRKIIIVGKGDKQRSVYFGESTRRRLWNYCATRGGVRGESYLFQNERGGPFTRSGLHSLVAGLGRIAHLTRDRVCPHTFRHTFAVNFLRAGGNVFTLKELLGHETLQMTMKYVHFAQTDLAGQHRQFAPDDSLYR